MNWSTKLAFEILNFPPTSFQIVYIIFFFSYQHMWFSFFFQKNIHARISITPFHRHSCNLSFHLGYHRSNMNLVVVPSTPMQLALPSLLFVVHVLLHSHETKHPRILLVAFRLLVLINVDSFRPQPGRFLQAHERAQDTLSALLNREIPFLRPQGPVPCKIVLMLNWDLFPAATSYYFSIPSLLGLQIP